MDRVWPAADSGHSGIKSASSSSSTDAQCRKIANLQHEERAYTPDLHRQTDTQRMYVRPRPRRSGLGRIWAWIANKFFIFEVTVGFYGLDWWERRILHMITLLLVWFVLYKSSQFVLICWHGLQQLYKTYGIIWKKWDPINGDVENLH